MNHELVHRIHAAGYGLCLSLYAVSMSGYCPAAEVRLLENRPAWVGKSSGWGSRLAPAT
jgi:hypothetical protein